MDNSFDTSQIPFGKFFDINGADKELVASLKLIKYEEIEPYEPEFLYLFESDKTGKFYCVWQKDRNLSSGSNKVIYNFVGDEFKQIHLIPPKREDWYQTHWLYELTK